MVQRPFLFRKREIHEFGQGTGVALHDSQITELAQLFSNQNLQHHLSAADLPLPGAPRRVDHLLRARLMRDVPYQQGTPVSHAACACAPRRCRMPRSARACAPFMYVRDPPTDAQVMGPDTCPTSTCLSRVQARRQKATGPFVLAVLSFLGGIVNTCPPDAGRAVPARYAGVTHHAPRVCVRHRDRCFGTDTSCHAPRSPTQRAASERPRNERTIAL